ncbi:hypothetical protein [Emticicia sp.]
MSLLLFCSVNYSSVSFFNDRKRKSIVAGGGFETRLPELLLI